MLNIWGQREEYVKNRSHYSSRDKKYCCFHECSSTSYSEGIKLFTFPSNVDIGLRNGLMPFQERMKDYYLTKAMLSKQVGVCTCVICILIQKIYWKSQIEN